MAQKTLDIVMPAYNEADNILPTVRDTYGKCRQAGVDCHVILVNDGSTDATPERMEEARREFAGLTVVDRKERGGLGRALRAGFAHTRGTHVTWLPADGEIRVSEALKLFQKIENADMVTSYCVREVTLKRLGNPLTRKILSFGMNLLTYATLGFNPSQHGGCWILRKDVLDRIPLISSTGFANYEILYFCRTNELDMRHGTVHAEPRLSGASKVANFRTILASLKDIFSFYAVSRLRRVKRWLRLSTNP